MVIVCRSVAPLSLISHLPVLCHLRQLPLITLHPHINSRMLAQALQAAAPQPQLPAAGSTRNSDSSSTRGLQLCMALAIKVSSRRQLHMDAAAAASDRRRMRSGPCRRSVSHSQYVCPLSVCL